MQLIIWNPSFSLPVFCSMMHNLPFLSQNKRDKDEPKSKTLHQEMLIYNRRGELVFSCKGTDCAWNGRDFNGNPCVQGAYVYIIRYSNEFEPNVTHTIRGTVMLIR